MEIVGPENDILEEDIVVMQCITYGSKPEAQIIWKNGY